jgi:hypothetical protein
MATPCNSAYENILFLRFGLQVGTCQESFAQPPVPPDASGRKFVLKGDLMR